MTEDKTFPVDSFLPAIAEAIANHAITVLEAAPGAGKSTRVPLSLINLPAFAAGKIVMLEPRRIAARSIATFLASTLGEKVGQTVGYQIRNERVVSKQTKLEIVTEGILTRRIQDDPELPGTSLIIFDEFHERSINADLSLTFALEIQQALRDDLKILVMSATLDAQKISEFFGGAPIISCPGKVFPVATHYLDKPVQRDLVATLQRTVCRALNETDGDILVFLPGKKEISLAMDNIAKDINPKQVSLLPLWGGLSNQSQDETLRPDNQGRRKIIFATNIAETSLTIEGIGCVIDSGLARVSLFDPASGMSRLDTRFVSLASADQRKGRAGRLREGSCYRLWTESQHKGLTPHYEAEIIQADLSSLCLELAQWGVKSLNELKWLTRPPAAHFAQAKDMLVALGFISGSGGITPGGLKAMTLGVHPRLAKMIIAGNDRGLGALACDIAALLAERDILINYNSCDIVARLMALQDYRASRSTAKKQYHFNLAATEQALQNSENWQKKLSIVKANKPCSLNEMSQHCGPLLAFAFPDRIGKRRKGDESRFQLANGKGALVRAEDPVGANEWIVVGNLDGQRREGLVYLAAPIALQDIKQAFSYRFTTAAAYSYDKDRNEIYGKEQTCFGKILLTSADIREPDNDKLVACLLQTITDSNFTLLPWNRSSESLLTRIRWLAAQHPEFPSLSNDWLKENLSEWLMPYLNNIKNIKGLQKLNLTDILKNAIGWNLQQELADHAPEVYVSPSGKQVPIVYSETRDPIVSIVLQEMFGEIESPKLAYGKKAITFELLSPAKRPIQITGDLKNFWHTSYYEVAKDMRGKYPKHRWPDEPMKELPGRSIKKK